MKPASAIAKLPWEELDSVNDEIEDAERTGDQERQRLALERKKEVLEACGAIGAFLLQMAFAYGSNTVSKEIERKFGYLAHDAMTKANRASRRAKAALDAVSAVESHLRMLERRVDDLTPTVGPPEPDATMKAKVIELAARVRILEAKVK